eukprot:GGOE01049240.1.p2 GENE.GGOE01049240.1~~GGOE01049240.1.p2  ORF type:complete len:116 (-),score=29.34 GGOE01049240.1:479-826(-)
MSGWNASLFGCLSDIPLCFMTWCLPCIPSGRTLAWVRGKPDDSMLYIVATCIIGWFGFFCCLGFYNRDKMRMKFGIQGSFLMDCFVSWCCLCCSMEQQARQIGCQAFSGPTEPVR